VLDISSNPFSLVPPQVVICPFVGRERERERERGRGKRRRRVSEREKKKESIVFFKSGRTLTALVQLSQCKCLVSLQCADNARLCSLHQNLVKVARLCCAVLIMSVPICVVLVRISAPTQPICHLGAYFSTKTNVCVMWCRVHGDFWLTAYCKENRMIAHLWANPCVCSSVSLGALLTETRSSDVEVSFRCRGA
jgi:hypothetical protein